MIWLLVSVKLGLAANCTFMLNVDYPSPESGSIVAAKNQQDCCDICHNMGNACAVAVYLARQCYIKSDDLVPLVTPGGCVACHKNPKPPVTFRVFRAENSASLWSNHLGNVNAADEAGVLAYLHTEVVPIDKGSGPCRRHSDIDVIMRYDITVLNPPGSPTPPHNGFVGFERGVCTVPNCSAIFDELGFYIGEEDQVSPWHAYEGHRYSLPQGGLCESPTGKKDCTYSYRLTGKVLVDALVNSWKSQIVPNYTKWCTDQAPPFKGVEYNGTNCTTFTSVDFWRSPCDASLCTQRVNSLESIAFTSALTNGCNAITGKSYNKDGICVSRCGNGYYADWNYRCQPCDTQLQCATCWDSAIPGENSSGCSTCTGAAPFLNQTRCISSCPSGFFPEQVDNESQYAVQVCTACNGTDDERCGGTPSPRPHPPQPDKGLSGGEIAAIVFGVIFFLLLLLLCIWCLCCRKREHPDEGPLLGDAPSTGGPQQPNTAPKLKAVRGEDGIWRQVPDTD